MNRAEKAQAKHLIESAIRDRKLDAVLNEMATIVGIEKTDLETTLRGCLGEKYSTEQTAKIIGMSTPWVTYKARQLEIGEQLPHYGRQKKYLFDYADINVLAEDGQKQREIKYT